MCDCRLVRISVVAMSLILAISTASYGVTVYDPANWAQNFYTALQSVQQNDKLLRQLHNQVTMINYDYQNLRRLQGNIGDSPMQTVQNIEAMLNRVQGINYTLQGLDQSYRDLYQQFGEIIKGASPSEIQARRLAQIITTARTNIDAMRVQAQVIEGINSDLNRTEQVLRRSRNAQGNLDVQQYGNELTAMQIKQQMKTQQLIAVQNRLQSTRLAEEQAKDYALDQDYKFRMRNWGSKKSNATPLNDFPH